MSHTCIWRLVVSTFAAVFALFALVGPVSETRSSSGAARSSANEAQCSADEAQCLADEAQCLADEAQCLADEAQCSADEAQCSADETRGRETTRTPDARRDDIGVALAPPMSSDRRIDTPTAAHARHLPMTTAETFELDDDFERLERVLVLVALLARAPDSRDLRTPRAKSVCPPRGVLLDGARSLRGPPVAG